MRNNQHVDDMYIIIIIYSIVFHEKVQEIISLGEIISTLQMVYGAKGHKQQLLPKAFSQKESKWGDVLSALSLTGRFSF